MTEPSFVFDFSTIEMAFEYANFGESENSAYLDRNTGRSLYFSAFGDSDPTPEDFDDETRYIAIPDRRDLGLGSQLAFEFAKDVAPQLLDAVHESFRGRGGFRRFKNLLDRDDLLESWHKYGADQERAAIMEWCADNNIHYTTNEPKTE